MSRAFLLGAGRSGCLGLGNGRKSQPRIAENAILGWGTRHQLAGSKSYFHEGEGRPLGLPFLFVAKNTRAKQFSGKRADGVRKVREAARRHVERGLLPLGKQTSKRRGEIAELEFLRKAVRLGFRVSKPYGDSDRYDFVVDTGEKLLRVQVKSASRLSQGAYFISSQRCSNGRAIPYKIGEIDYLAGYVFPEDAWFIIPVEAFVPRKSIHVFPKERGKVGMYAEYREAWW